MKELHSDPFDAGMLQAGRCVFFQCVGGCETLGSGYSENTYRVVVRLCDDQGRLLDESLPIRFGFREFWIDGRDFYLNGTPVHLRALSHGNINAQADRGSLEGCLNTCRSLQEYGFNAAITSAYDFAPGTVGYLDAFFEAADETGVLTAFTLPHTKDFASKLDDPEQQARYKARAEWLIRAAQNHPSIVFYTMNHNSNGYYGDQNPLKIDGKYDPAAAGAIGIVEYEQSPAGENRRGVGRVDRPDQRGLQPPIGQLGQHASR